LGAPVTMPDVMAMAAGLGTRMRPLTFDTPKPLLKVAGQTLLDHALAGAIDEGCTRFVVNIHHHPDQMRDHLEALTQAGREVVVSDETKALLDTGGGLRKALPLLKTDPILVLNTDTFWLPGPDRPIARMIEAGREGADIVLLCVAPERAMGLRKGPDFMVDGEGTLSATLGRPVFYAGAALISRALAASGPEGAFSLYRHFQAARDAGRLRGVMLEAPWFHVGDPGALAQTEQALEAIA